MSTEENYKYKVTLSKEGWGESVNVMANQFQVDEHGTLSFYIYRDMKGYSLPQLRTKAAFPRGSWISVREISDQ